MPLSSVSSRNPMSAGKPTRASCIGVERRGSILRRKAWDYRVDDIIKSFYAKMLVVGPRLCNLTCSAERAVNFVVSNVSRAYPSAPKNITADANSKPMLASWFARAMSPGE